MHHHLPAPTQRPFHSNAGVVQPTLIDKSTGTIWATGPRRHGNGVDDQPEAIFGPFDFVEGALQSCSRLALLSNIDRSPHKFEDLARRAEHRMPHYAERAVGSVFRDQGKVTVKRRLVEARSFE